MLEGARESWKQPIGASFTKFQIFDLIYKHKFNTIEIVYYSTGSKFSQMNKGSVEYRQPND